MNNYSYLGSIMLFAGNFAPQGWMYCNGATLAVNQWNALYSLLGSTYGGDGEQDFKLPNLVGPVSTGTSLPLNYIICVEGIFPDRA
jgi:microcystin-dependent protein